MKTITRSANRPFAMIRHLALMTGFAASPVPADAADAATASATEPENFVTFSGGGSLLRGDRDQFQRLRQQKKDGWGGVESFHFGRDIDNTTRLTADGHALAGNDDFELDLKLVREDVGFLRAGLKQYRMFLDGSGGYFPPTSLFFHLYDEDLHLDRGDFWVEAGTTRPDQINFDFRYDYTTRDGRKDSTVWGDTNSTGGLGTRAVVPTFLDIREHRHIVRASASRRTERTSWQLDGRYENQSQDNSRNIRRQPVSATDRDVTQHDRADVDLFMVHGALETRLGPTLTLGTGAAHYRLDNLIGGSRIYGGSYDSVFDATFARRQFHDEGFFNLEGKTHLRQTLANVNLMYTPSENWTIVPELRAQRSNWGGDGEFTETDVGAAPAFAPLSEELRSQSGKSFRDLTEVIEVRYNGWQNVALNASVEATQGYGMLAEDLIELETGVEAPYRTTDFRRDLQKVEFSAHWYPRAGLSFSTQYCWKGRQNSFSNSRTSSAPDGADRYPAYITHQDVETNDVNVRVSWSPLLQLRAVTRYDYQESELRSQEIGLSFIQSGKVRTHMIGEMITWSPLPRWYVQASGNLVYDTVTSPAHDLTGAVRGVVLNGDNNYFNGDISTGYVLDDRTDVTVSYAFYRADNYVDNSRVSQPYGADAKTQFVSVTLFCRVSPTLRYAVRYAYADHRDIASGNNDNFRAHTIYGAVQHRF